MSASPVLATMPAMKSTRNSRHPHVPQLDANLDTDVAWARRKETISGALKQFRLVLDAVRRHAEWVEARHDISAAQLWVLWELVQAPGMRAADLARAMAIPRPAAEGLLEGLHLRGLVRRQAAVPESQGTEHFFPTYDGQSIADASPQYGQGVLKAAMAKLPEATLDELSRGLASLVEHLAFREDGAAQRPMAELLRSEAPQDWPRP